MKKETFEKLVDKMASHFPLEEGSIAGFGYPGQEPYKTDLLRILIQAFKDKKEETSEISWDSFSEVLLDEVLAKRPHLTPEQTTEIFEKTRNMWEEWLYILNKIRAENITLMENGVKDHASIFIAVE